MLTYSKTNALIYYLTLGIIILISFFCYSSRYYPLLNSDDAISVLMAHYYKLPNDFYCWGQDRGGTLIPMISQVFIKLFNCSALMAVSLSNYLILILGYIGFSSLLRTRFNKILFALILFLPFQRFIDVLRFPIGVEYCLIAFAIFSFNKLDRDARFVSPRNIILLFGTITFLIAAVWMSDLALVSISILFFVWFIFDYWKNTKSPYSYSVMTFCTLGIIFGYLFITYARGFSTVKAHEYFNLNNFESMKKAAWLVKKALADVFNYNTKEIAVTAFAYLCTLFLTLLLVFIIRKKEITGLLKNKWISFFAMDAVVVLIVFFTASWVLANNMGRWYFVASYISLSMLVLLSMEQLQLKLHSIKHLQWLLIATILTGSISPIITMKHTSPKTLKPTADTMAEFEQLGEIGIIGEYWNGYICSVTNPNKIKSTPHDKTGSVRNLWLAETVLNQPKLYVIKDMWMDHFPDTLQQFGRTLIKKGNDFKKGNCSICEYKVLK